MSGGASDRESAASAGWLLVLTRFIVAILRQSRHSVPADDTWPEPLESSV